MPRSKKPKAREVHHLWAWSSKTAVFPGGSYRITWAEDLQAWTVQFPRVVYVLHTEGQRNLPIAGNGKDGEDIDLFHEDPSLFQRCAE